MFKIWSTENLKHLSFFWDREYYIVVMKYAEDSWICSKFVLPLSRYVSRQENKPTTNAMDEKPCYPCVLMMTFGWASINAQACFKHQRFYIKQLVYTPLRTYTPCSLGLSATKQQYFSLRTNQPPTTSQQYFSLRTNQHRSSATSQTNRPINR
jgi:hypothetical protein